MNMTNKFMSTFHLALNSSQPSFNENGTNIPSSTLDVSLNGKEFKNYNIKSMMTIDQEQNEEFSRESQLKRHIWRIIIEKTKL